MTRDGDQVVGATKLGWLYMKSRKWGLRMLRMWREQDEASGRIPPRTFTGAGGAIYTTLAAIAENMPPGRDLALYERLTAKDEATADEKEDD